MAGPGIGDAAPEFALDGTSPEGRRAVRLSELRGRPVVLAFYPGDDTPVCTAQLCSYQDDLDVLTGLDATVLGISPQGLDSHERFAARRGLTFPLLADADKAVAREYGVVGPLGLRRAVFVVDAHGVVRWKHVTTFGITFPTAATIAAALRDLAA